VLGAVACGSESKSEVNSFTERSSYAIGQDMGRTLQRSVQQSQVDIDLPSLLQGLSDAMNDREGLMSEAEIIQTLQELNTRVQEAQTASRAQAAEENLRAGDAYQQQNREKDGVITTASGLQYEVLSPGDGPTPQATDRVSVHYRGMLVDGTEFNNSYQSGNPATFAVGGVIPGWQEGLQLMNVGGKYRFVLPPDLAYGEGGSPPAIPPSATLIFEVELLSIER